MGRIAQAVTDSVNRDYDGGNAWRLHLPREIGDLYYGHTRTQANMDALRMTICASRKNSSYRVHDGNVETCGN